MFWYTYLQDPVVSMDSFYPFIISLTVETQILNTNNIFIVYTTQFPNMLYLFYKQLLSNLVLYAFRILGAGCENIA